MRTRNPSSSARETRQSPSSTTSNFKDMLWVVQNWILKIDPPPQPTVFRLEEGEIFHNLLYQMHRDCPRLVGDPDALGRAIQAYAP